MLIKQHGELVCFMFQIMIFNENINMANGDIKILENLSINQNVICLVLSYIGIAYAASHNDLMCLSCMCWILFIASSLSVIISLIAYSIEYWAKKWYRAKHPDSK